MPYVLTHDTASHAHLRLWPHNALAPRGFAAVIGVSAAFLALPLIALLGTPLLWGLLPFAVLSLAGLWLALSRNWRDRGIVEEMNLSRAEVALVRRDPGGQVRDWRADPAWVALHLIPRGGPVAHYLTLTGAGREVELGAFLTPEERVALHDDLARVLVRLKGRG